MIKVNSSYPAFEEDNKKDFILFSKENDNCLKEIYLIPFYFFTITVYEGHLKDYLNGTRSFSSFWMLMSGWRYNIPWNQKKDILSQILETFIKRHSVQNTYYTFPFKNFIYD